MVVHEAKENEKYENYPIKIVCISATLTILSYLFGTVVFYILHPILGILFLCLVISTIIISMKLRCTHCYYLGKYCNFGLGKLAALLFKKGDPSEFKNPKLVITTAIVSFGTMLLPIIAGIIIILMDLTVFSLSLFLGYILIGIAPNFVVRGRFCEKCVQGQLGCPSYEQMIKRRGR
jgi:hypothetical protein